jgi:hypothetical protein
LLPSFCCFCFPFPLFLATLVTSSSIINNTRCCGVSGPRGRQRQPRLDEHSIQSNTFFSPHRHRL